MEVICGSPLSLPHSIDPIQSDYPSALVVPGAGGGPRRRDGRHGGRLDGHELGQVDPVHLAGVLRHDVLDHVDPPAEARRADVARNLVLVVLEVSGKNDLFESYKFRTPY